MTLTVFEERRETGTLDGSTLISLLTTQALLSSASIFLRESYGITRDSGFLGGLEARGGIEPPNKGFADLVVKTIKLYLPLVYKHSLDLLSGFCPATL